MLPPHLVNRHRDDLSYARSRFGLPLAGSVARGRRGGRGPFSAPHRSRASSGQRAASRTPFGSVARGRSLYPASCSRPPG